MTAKGTEYMPWSEEEDAELMRLRQVGRTYSQCGELIGRTANACATRMSWLTRRAGRQRIAPALWTREEDETLQKLWPVMSVAQIAEQMNRSPKGVYRRANRLGLACGKVQEAKKAWTAEDDAVLKENLDTLTYAEIGLLLGRTEKSVKARALNRNLRGGPEPRMPKPKGYLRKCHDCGKPTPDFRCPKCWAKIRASGDYMNED